MTLPAIEYRLILDKPEWEWPVYAGQDGSIVVYKPEFDEWEQLGQSWGDNGYWVVSVKEKTKRVHVLIALAFDGPKTQPTVRHLDGEKDNNEASNLKWGTAKQQQEDERKEGNCRRNTFWKEAIRKCEPNLIDWNSLPHLNGKKRYLTKAGERQTGHIVEGCKWKIRGITADRDILDAMPEKRSQKEFGSGGHSPIYNSAGDFVNDIRVPEWDVWEAGTLGTVHNFSKGGCLSTILVCTREWVPYSERFTDDNYNALRPPFIR